MVVAQRTGPKGKVIGVDFSDAMLVLARQAAAKVGVGNVEFYQADAEDLPIEDGVIDVVLVNGIFNLNPMRDSIFRELVRVVQQGGTVYAAELILRQPLPQEVQDSEANWFA